MLLRRRELNEHFRALQGLGPLTFDNVFHWCLVRSTVWEPHERAEDLRRFVAADPSDRASRVAMAETLRQLGRRDEAASVLSALPDSDPDARAVRAGSRSTAATRRRPPHCWRRVLPITPSWRGSEAGWPWRSDDAPAAVRHFRAAIAAEPDDRDSLFGLGSALAMTGDRQAARRPCSATRRPRHPGCAADPRRQSGRPPRPGAAPRPRRRLRGGRTVSRKPAPGTTWPWSSTPPTRPPRRRSVV